MKINVRLLFAVAMAQGALCASALEFKVEREIPYYPEDVLAKEGPYARSWCRLDLKWPVGVTNFATVVNLHGGGIVAGRKHPSPWPAEMRDRDPIAFVSGGYRLLTNATPAQAISDAAAVVAWTLKNISKYGGDPKKVFVTGVSAGGYLTAMVGMDYRWLAPHGFKPTDLAGIAPLTGQMTKHFNVRRIGFKDADPQYMPKIDEWAPLHYASTNPLPPSCFLTGGRDIEWKARVEENALLEASIRACGHRNSEFHETEGNHGGGVYPSTYLLRDFVAKTCDVGAVGRFADGERIAFFGDSITHGGRWHAYLQLFWSTRYPGSDVRVLNCGISGDSASRALSRIESDLLYMKPDRVFVMFGMNDVGRNDYPGGTPSADVQKRRERNRSVYVASQRKIVERLAREGVKTVLVTPSPYDQYSSVSTANLADVNGIGLKALAADVRGIATQHGLGLVDLHGPMTEMFKARKDRPFAADRVHPNSEGHMVMAAHVLETMGVNPYVAHVAIDAKRGKVYRPIDPDHKDAKGKRLFDTRNATVTHVSVRKDGIAFTYAPKALPFPSIKPYVDAESVYPLTKRFNREVFKIEGLPAGTYELLFDGAKVGEFTSGEFDAGVNVALLDTPNRKIAMVAAETMERLFLRYASRRSENKPGISDEIDDLYERLNAVRPAVSRVVLRLKKR